LNQIKNKYLGGYTEYPLFFKLSLVFGIVIMAFVFIYYTQNVINKLKENSTRVVNAYAKLWQLVAVESTTGEEINLIFEEVIQKSQFPIIVTDQSGEPQAWREVGVKWDDTTFTSRQKLKRLVKHMDQEKKPVPIYYGDSQKEVLYLHYGDPKFIQQLRWMPLVEIGVIALLVLAAFISFRNIKRSEQRSIWVGMAKETAHQLGTPLSSLLGWLELLEAKCGPENKEALEWIKKDIKRLEKIAHRFEQIGSIPELKTTSINPLVSEAVSYFKVKLPHNGLGVIIKENLSELEPIKINPELLSWVLENLIKNSLEAVDPKSGVIEVCTGMNRERKSVIIEVRDDGRGIPPREQKKIFSPGYTTKKRGWGLGLSLAKRIVEDYHSGKIFLSKSVPNVNTTFTVMLPLEIKR
jgi:signal transduction histidine kinase